MTKTPSGTGGALDFLRVCWCQACNARENPIPVKEDFLDFGAKRLFTMRRLSPGGRRDVNEVGMPIHAAETSAAYTARPDFTENSP